MSIHKGVSSPLRAFVGVSVPASVRRELAARVAGLRRASEGSSDQRGWVRTANYHVTLRFLGNVARDDVAEIERRLEAALAEHPPFLVETGEMFWLRAHRNRSVLALSLLPEGSLQELASRVATAFSANRGDDRPFVPHLTLARLPRAVRRTLRMGALSSDSMSCSWEVREVTLFESRQTAKGVSYETLASIPLSVPNLTPRIVHQGEPYGPQRFQ